jgi:hypothetical protein
MAEPWGADRLAMVLSAAAEEDYSSRARITLTSTATGTSESYEPEEPAGPDDAAAPLILVRASDGARFEVEFWANVARLGAKEAGQ